MDVAECVFVGGNGCFVRFRFLVCVWWVAAVLMSVSHELGWFVLREAANASISCSIIDS